jgi:hypothetical protein
MKQDKQNTGSQGKEHDAGKQSPGSQSKEQGQVQGEGDYEAARRYRDKLSAHVQHHDMDQEARNAEPTSAGEEREMEQAEEAGKRRAKEEDPLLEHPEGATGGKGGTKPGAARKSGGR